MAGKIKQEVSCRLQDLQSERDIKSLIDGLPSYVLLIDEDHCIVIANKATEKSLGKISEEIQGGYCPAIVHGMNEPFPGCPLEESVVKKKSVIRELYDEKTKRWMSSAIYPSWLKTTEGKRVYFHTVSDITEHKQLERQAQISFQRLETAFHSLIGTLALTVETRDPYTASHQRKVAELSCVIAREMGLSEDKIESLNMAATVHDVGKIYVPSEILNKPGKLTDLEFDLIKTHVDAGYNILKDIEFRDPVAEMVRQHHERLDGSGYPQGLKDGKILQCAKIMAVADVVEAMSTDRPYRPALGIDIAIEEVEKNKGKFYDPAVVDTCVKLFREKSFKF